MTPIETFQGDFFKSIWDHTLKMVKYSTLIGVSYFAIIMTLVIGIFTRILNLDIEQYLVLAQNPNENLQQMEEFSLKLSEEMIANWPVLLVIFLLIILFQAYIYTILVRTSRDVVEGEKPRFLDIFSNADFRSVLSMFLASVILILIYAILSIVAMLLSSIHALFTVAMFLFIILFLSRFVAFVPGIVIAKLGVIESFRYSLERITWNRAAKMILISIALGIVLVIVLMATSMITMFLGSFGSGINLLLNVALQIFSLAGLSAFFTGLHYRYMKEEISTTQNE